MLSAADGPEGDDFFELGGGVMRVALEGVYGACVHREQKVTKDQAP